jgi:hypothetical protein
MFNYEQNVHLTQIHQHEQIDQAERSRLAADGKPTSHIYGAVFAYTARKCGELGQALKRRPVSVETSPTSTQELLAVR